jgi:hypothetical protein
MSYSETVKRILFSPKQFFQELSLTGGYEEPLKFAIANMSIGVILSFAANLVRGKIAFGVTSLITTLLGGVIFAIISMFIGFGIIHGLLKLFGAKKGFEATFRVGAYMTAFVFLSWIPYVVYAVMLYVLYLEVVIFARVHEISTLRSFLAVTLIPIILLITILAAGASYLWVSSLQRDVMLNTQNQLTTINSPESGAPITAGSNARFSIDSVFNKDNQINVVLRNTGQTPISGNDIKAYISGAAISSSGCSQLNPSGVCTLVLGAEFPSQGTMANIRIASGAASVAYVCYAAENGVC